MSNSGLSNDDDDDDDWYCVKNILLNSTHIAEHLWFVPWQGKTGLTQTPKRTFFQIDKSILLLVNLSIIHSH